MKKLLAGIIVGGAISLCPIAVNAQDHGQSSENSSHKTYYDAAHKDNHEWNDNENTAWNKYRDENHIKTTDFAKTNRKQQQNYWNWRHGHPDDH